MRISTRKGSEATDLLLLISLGVVYVWDLDKLRRVFLYALQFCISYKFFWLMVLPSR